MSDPYGSHVPFLRWIGAHICPIRRVLELGAGQYSTPLWLDRSVFPDVERVTTVEQDKHWVPVLTDPRLMVIYMNPVDWLFWDAPVFHEADLIFVDNGPVEADRIRAIQLVTHMHDIPLVVLHDWEDPRYRAAAEGGYDWMITDDAMPQSALLIRRGR